MAVVDDVVGEAAASPRTKCLFGRGAVGSGGYLMQTAEDRQSDDLPVAGAHRALFTKTSWMFRVRKCDR